MKKHKLLLLFLIVALAISLLGCTKNRVEFTMFIDAAPISLDPQVAKTPSEITSVLHLYNALFRKNPDGKIEAEAAEDFSISDDGLTYTIKLKSNQKWNSYVRDDSTITLPLTADDYVFGIQRVFMQETKSPHAEGLSAIKNSRQVLSGKLGIDALGVRQVDELTIELVLSHPDPMFLERLSMPGAMPCNREFFYGTSGAYGLSGATVLTNGRFNLTAWTSGTAIGLSKKSPSKGEINYLRMIVPEDKSLKDSTPLSRLEDGTTNGELLTGDFTDTDFNATVFSTTSWVLVFNCAQKPFNNENIRSALTHSAYSSNYTENSDALIKSVGLVPPSITMIGQSYREFAGNTLPTGNATSLFRQGMTEAGLKNLSNVTVLVPDEGDFADSFAEINQQWQKDLSVFFSVRSVERAELIATINSGKYQIALMPIQQSENDVLPLLTKFSQKDNFCFFADSEFNSIISQIENLPQGNERAKLYREAEILLQQKAPVIPLFYETSTYLFSQDVQGLVISPYGPVIDITFASQG